MNYLTDELLNENASLTLRKYKGWGQVMRAYAYNYLMECYVDSYTNGGSSKLGLSIYTSTASTILRWRVLRPRKLTIRS